MPSPTKRKIGKGPLLKILLVEDSESDVVLFEHLLEEEAAKKNTIQILDVPRLSDAFLVIRDEQFDVIMLDLNLLDIQGIASVAALHAELPDTPIIVFSGMDDPKIFKEALLCGAHSYLVKGKETGSSIDKIISGAINKF